MSGIKGMQLKQSHPKKPFCIHGHEIAIVGRNPHNGSCKQCQRDRFNEDYVAKPKKQFCLRGHNISICGRYKGYCNDCKALVIATPYGLSLDQYRELFKRQDNKCAICKRDKSQISNRGLAIDHNHTTGKVRGLLCRDCNTALGGFKDSLLLLKNAVIYLELYD